MRKALIGLIVASALTPAAAYAQSERAERVRERMEQRQQQRSEPRSEQRQQRSERVEQRVEQRQDRSERVEQRQDRGGQQQAQRWQQRQPQQQPQAQQQPPQQPQADRGQRRPAPADGAVVGWQGPRTQATRRDAERYDERARENAWRHGTEAQRREVIRQDRQNDRRDGNWRDDRNDRNWRDNRNRNWQRDWDRGWRNDRRYDWQDYRYRNRHVYRGSRYYSPYRNHRYSRFSIGFYLQPLFYSRNYWIGDPWQYRLPYAPPGTQWVRYYNDVLLVDVYTGEVVDVIYDFFW